MIDDRIAEALAGGLPVALVGDATPLRHAAASLGLAVLDLAAESLAALDDMPRAPHANPGRVVLVGGCERIAQGGPLEMPALDLAFDGHPAFGDADVVVLHFAEPTDMSEALADDAIPCAFVGVDASLDAEEESPRLAA